jgi:tRNA-specific 2-thiouridylase
VVLGDEEDLYTEYVEATGINLISCERIDNPIRVNAKVRYRQEEQSGIAEQVNEDKLRIKFDTKQKSVAIGQALVLYDKETVIGGGTISATY